MIKMILKKTLLLSLPLLMTNAVASNKEGLAKQCHDLSQIIFYLGASQSKALCEQRLSLASEQTHTASGLILDEENAAAKEALDTAIYSLQYAELDGCYRFIEISHAKFEANRIKNAL